MLANVCERLLDSAHERIADDAAKPLQVAVADQLAQARHRTRPAARSPLGTGVGASPRSAPTARRVSRRPSRAKLVSPLDALADRARRLPPEPTARRSPPTGSSDRPASARARHGCRARSASTPQAVRPAAAPPESAGSAPAAAPPDRRGRCIWRMLPPASATAVKPSRVGERAQSAAVVDDRAGRQHGRTEPRPRSARAARRREPRRPSRRRTQTRSRRCLGAAAASSAAADRDYVHVGRSFGRADMTRTSRPSRRPRRSPKRSAQRDRARWWRARTGS